MSNNSELRKQWTLEIFKSYLIAQPQWAANNRCPGTVEELMIDSIHHAETLLNMLDGKPKDVDDK